MFTQPETVSRSSWSGKISAVIGPLSCLLEPRSGNAIAAIYRESIEVLRSAEQKRVRTAELAGKDADAPRLSDVTSQLPEY